MFKEETIAILKEKLQKKNVASRGQAGRTFSYIESHHAIREANRAFGFDGWNYTVDQLNPVCEPYENHNGNSIVSYIAIVTIDVNGTTRQDTGFGQGISKDVGQAHESASKEAVSDAMKRALRTFGDIFGLALYDKDQANVTTMGPEAMADAIMLINACESKNELQEYYLTLSQDAKADLLDEFKRKRQESK